MSNQVSDTAHGVMVLVVEVGSGGYGSEGKSSGILFVSVVKLFWNCDEGDARLALA